MSDLNRPPKISGWFLKIHFDFHSNLRRLQSDLGSGWENQFTPRLMPKLVEVLTINPLVPKMQKLKICQLTLIDFYWPNCKGCKRK